MRRTGLCSLFGNGGLFLWSAGQWRPAHKGVRSPACRQRCLAGARSPYPPARMHCALRCSRAFCLFQSESASGAQRSPAQSKRRNRVLSAKRQGYGVKRKAFPADSARNGRDTDRRPGGTPCRSRRHLRAFGMRRHLIGPRNDERMGLFHQLCEAGVSSTITQSSLPICPALKRRADCPVVFVRLMPGDAQRCPNFVWERELPPFDGAI